MKKINHLNTMKKSKESAILNKSSTINFTSAKSLDTSSMLSQNIKIEKYSRKHRF